MREKTTYNCWFCQKKERGKKITLINAEFIHKDCATYLEERPDEITHEMQSLYERRNSLIKRIISIFSFDPKNNPDVIEALSTSLSEEYVKICNKRKRIYDYWPDYPPDWKERCQEVKEKAGNKCEDCEQPEDYLGLHVHHLKFRRRGGNHKPLNLKALCVTCHEEKHGGITFDYDNKSFKPLAFTKRIETIKKAIKSNKNIKFSYLKFKEKKYMRRNVKPNKLTKKIWVDEKFQYFVNHLYLVGHCYLREDSRTFRLDRMKGLRIEK